jgi:hypothetical protein
MAGMTFPSILARFNEQIVLLVGSGALAVPIRAGVQVRWFSCDLG